MAGTISPSDRDVLLVVDVQNDFCPGGRLAVPRGDEVVRPINRLCEKFRHVVLTQDWHPVGHLSFASSHPGRQPFDTITVAYGCRHATYAFHELLVVHGITGGLDGGAFPCQVFQRSDSGGSVALERTSA